MPPASNRTERLATLIAIAAGWLLIARHDTEPDEPHPATKGPQQAESANRP